MPELASDSLHDPAPDPQAQEGPEEKLGLNDVFKIVGFVVLGVLLALFIYGVFRYLLVQSYGGY